MFARSLDWWKEYRFPDPEHRRHGAGPRFTALLELDGKPVGVRDVSGAGLLDEGFAALAAAHPGGDGGLGRRRARELWRFLFGIDRGLRVESWLLPV